MTKHRVQSPAKRRSAMTVACRRSMETTRLPVETPTQLYGMWQLGRIQTRRSPPIWITTCAKSHSG